MGKFDSLPPILLTNQGLFLRPSRYPEQAFSEHTGHHSCEVFWSSSCVFWRISTSLSGSCELDSSPLRIQTSVYLGTLSLWGRCIGCLALYPASLFRRLLCCYLHHRKWLGVLGNCCKPVHHRYNSSALLTNDHS